VHDPTRALLGVRVRAGVVVRLAMLAGLRPEGWKPPPQIGPPEFRCEPESPKPRKEGARPWKPCARERKRRERMSRIFDEHANGATVEELCQRYGLRRHGVLSCLAFERVKRSRRETRTDRAKDTRKSPTP
jgi:uncharacterized protein (DUF433 family)